jgi:YidC/Oxa1 family membrane protein insertase
MSRPAPTQKSNLVQTLLIMTMVYMGVMIFFNRQQQPQAPTYDNKPLITRADYLKALHKADAEVKEVTAQKLQSDFNGVVETDVSKKVLTRDQGDTQKIEAAVLVADAFYKAGLIKDDTNKIRMGYQSLQTYKRKMSSNPGWNQPIAITLPDNKTQGEITADQMFTKIVDTLKTRNQTDLVYGVIPGGWQFINAMVHLTGAVPGFSYAFAAFLLALVVRAIVFPLSQKQLMFSRQMSQLAPRVKELKDQYKDDQTAQNAKVMELYREYGINPFSGCLPAFIQMPLFLTVYQCMLHYQFQFQNGTFLWINPAMSKATHGLLAANLGEQDYILVVIYGITMMISTLLTPVTDPTQKTQQRIMGVGMAIAFTVFMFFGLFPVVSGFVLYWTFTNILSTAQALRAYRLPLPPLVKVNTPAGGVYPSKGPKGKWATMIDEMQGKMAEEQRKAMESRTSIPEVLKEDRGSPQKSNGSTNGKPKPANSNGKLPKNGSSPSSGPDEGKTPKHKPKKRA